MRKLLMNPKALLMVKGITHGATGLHKILLSFLFIYFINFVGMGKLQLQLLLEFLLLQHHDLPPPLRPKLFLPLQPIIIVKQLLF